MFFSSETIYMKQIRKIKPTIYNTSNKYFGKQRQKNKQTKIILEK